MGQLWRDVRRHRVGSLFLLVLWVGYWTWVVIGARLGGDMDIAAGMVHPVLPLVAGMLVGWWHWRPEERDAGLTTALVAGGLLCLLDGAIAFAPLVYLAVSGRSAPPFGQLVPFAVAMLAFPGVIAAVTGAVIGGGLGAARRTRDSTPSQPRTRWGRSAS